MKIWFKDYELFPKKKLNGKSDLLPRKGSLLKVDWGEEVIGYSDVFPWEEFGDLNLEELKKELIQATPDFSLVKSPLLKRALERSLLDGQARKEKNSLFQDFSVPESHGLLPMNSTVEDLNAFRDMGFRVFKLKLTGQPLVDLPQTLSILNALLPEEKLRLDFNGLLSMDEFLQVLRALNDHSSKISQLDLIEDPWSAGNADVDSFRLPKQLREKFASDFCEHPSWKHKVVKSARQFSDRLFSFSNRVIVTHSMDHTLGQAFSLYESGVLNQKRPAPEVHGVARAQVYKSTDFDWSWEGSGPSPTPPQGTGIGFDEILRGISWKPLS
ncbi:MAG TPA: hypothetical protein DCL41_00655 [Bdellovibrionales bacterium]|nr:hypothetical protein [Bdellovibrionales bacterium]